MLNSLSNCLDLIDRWHRPDRLAQSFEIDERTDEHADVADDGDEETDADAAVAELKRFGHRSAEHLANRIADIAEEQHHAEQVDHTGRDLQQADDSILAETATAGTQRGEREQEGAC